MILSFLTVFFTILVDEIGDKSQLATLGFASTQGKWITFFASAAALIIASLVASFAGGWLQGKINPRYLSLSAGALFILIGAWTIFSTIRGK
jgi:putative Ca2+/H+ antiporter (TMEM165/GDT1 family)